MTDGSRTLSWIDADEQNADAGPDAITQRQRSIRERPLDRVDDDDIEWCALWFEFEPELFLDGGENRWPRRKRRSILIDDRLCELERDVERAVETGPIQDWPIDATRPRHHRNQRIERDHPVNRERAARTAGCPEIAAVHPERLNAALLTSRNCRTERAAVLVGLP